MTIGNILSVEYATGEKFVGKVVSFKYMAGQRMLYRDWETVENFSEMNWCPKGNSNTGAAGLLS